MSDWRRPALSSRSITRGALVLAWVGASSVAAFFLWRTTKVPGSLQVPRLSERAYFSSALLRRTTSFSRFQTADWALSEFTMIAVLVVYARYGVRLMRESEAGPIGTGVLLGMLGFALVWIAEIPFSVAELWWERRHDLSRVGYAAAIIGNWGALGTLFLFLSLSLLIVMWLAQRIGDRWWLAAAPVFVAITVFFAFVSPWLSSGEALRSGPIARDAAALERAEGIGRVPVVVADVHGNTTEPNAEATGIGPSRRIVLWDTIVDGRFTPRELRVVLGHEIGHLARNHIWKQLGWYALFAFPGAFIIAMATRRFGGMGHPEAVPASLLVLVVLQLLALPLQNLVTRHVEAEADWMALQTTHDPTAATSLFQAFARTTLAEPNPSTWEYVLLENHPTLMQRIAMAQAWRQRHPAG